MVFRAIQFIITLLILASLILQILSILGGFNALQSIYFLKVKLEPSSTSSGFLSGIFGSTGSSLLNSAPSFFTVAPFIVCEGSNDGSKNMCSPPSFGYRYESTGLLDTFQDILPDYVHRVVTGVQGGVFIPSVCFCFLLLVYNLFEYCGRNRAANCCKHIITTMVAGLALIFVIAFFVVQVVVYKVLKNEIEKAKNSLFGDAISNLVSLNISMGPSTWMTLAAMIAILLATVLLLLSICCVPRSNNRRRDESYEMGRV